MTDTELMAQAIAAAAAAGDSGEVPIGCAIYHAPSGRLVAVAANRRETDADATAHAEIVAIRAAGAAIGHWRLNDCTLAVTLEPCPMCAGAIVNARIPRLVYGADDPKAGAVRTLFSLCDDPRLNHRVEVVAGLLAAPCAELLHRFFQAQRAMGKK